MGNENSNPYINEHKWPKNSLGFFITHSQEVDEIFQEAGDLFDDFEFLRLQIKHKLQKVHELAGTKKLKKPSILNPIKIFLWSIASISQGDVEKSVIKNPETALTFQLQEEFKVHTRTWLLFESLEDLLSSFKKARSESLKIASRVSEIFTKIEAIKDINYINSEAENYQISKTSLAAKIEKNHQTFNNMYKMMFASEEFCAEIKEDYFHFLDNIQRFINEANSMGPTLYKKKLTNPKHIFEFFNEVDLFSM